jgi:hypothetical protein
MWQTRMRQRNVDAVNFKTNKKTVFYLMTDAVSSTQAGIVLWLRRPDWLM